MNNSKVFSYFLNGNDDQLPIIHQEDLKLFLHILEITDFHVEVNQFIF